MVTNEIALIYYGFLNFKSTKLASNEFTNYKGSGILSTLGAFIFVVAIEMITIHVIVSKWSLVFAWILTGLSIYSAIQLIGIIRSVPKRPIQIFDDQVVLRFGILSETNIPLQNIKHITFGNYSDVEKQKNTKTLSLLGELEQINTIIELKAPGKLNSIYGSPKTYHKLLLFVDDHQRFKEDIETRISKL